MAQEQSHSEGAGVLTFVERFAAELVEAGMPRMPGRVFAALIASEQGALTSAELSERLQVSPAAVSGAVRYLAQVGMIGRERDPGSRRERYRLHNDQWYETFTRRDAIIGRWEHTLRAGVEALGPGTQAGSRIEETAEFFAFLQKELHSMMDRWRDHKEQLREDKEQLRDEKDQLHEHQP
ncbi:GbsR/MarR family transcriptional regulator [Streptomyces sp. RKAG337]|uniref:GbsR/MarR family transcriptional regulator n=1 Tax=Streptomyces sp. RKAG337 TaxID=2893404 RepID=UPI0020331F10|nr:MarR family transcriptional regulator [Streptomyces sp. RKAG337]MCM2430258.1 MarR family transcriptional regulator [Streptomyces sp. RKAG337]